MSRVPAKIIDTVDDSKGFDDLESLTTEIEGNKDLDFLRYVVIRCSKTTKYIPLFILDHPDAFNPCVENAGFKYI